MSYIQPVLHVLTLAPVVLTNILSVPGGPPTLALKSEVTEEHGAFADKPTVPESWGPTTAVVAIVPAVTGI
jgi:hypothetical protein